MIDTGRAASPLLGDWTFRAEVGMGELAGTLHFEMDGPDLIAGTYIGMRGNATRLSSLKFTGERIAFDIVTARAVFHLDGTVAGNQMVGTFQAGDRTISWSATKRLPASTPAP